MSQDILEQDKDEDARVAAYLHLDLTKGSSTYVDLMDRTEKEYEEKGRMSLSDYLGNCPSGLTPQMRGWYSTFVEPIRVEAVQAVSAGFKKLNVNGVPGLWPQAELDEIENKRLRNTEDCIRTFHEKNEHLLHQVQDASNSYEMMRARHGRQPIESNPWLYWIVLCAIGFCELLLNFESLLRVPLITSPAFALGTALVLGAVIGAAGHIHGLLLKQFNWYFGPEDKSRNFQGLRLGLLGLILLIIGMIMVGGARYYYIKPKIAEALLLGLAPPAMALSVAFMMTGNFIVYGLAVAWSYFQHDLDPEFPDAKKRHDKLRRTYDQLFKVGIANEIGRLRLKAQKETETISNRRHAIEKADGFEKVQDLAAKILAQDQRVVAALVAYRSQLVDERTKAGKQLTFLNPVQRIEAGQRSETLDPAAYLATPIRLNLAN